MVILGLDISSSSTGWAVLKHGRFYSRENIDYGWIKPKQGLSLSKKLSYFREELIIIISKIKPDAIAIEDTFFFRNPSTLKLLSKFCGVAVEAANTVLGIESCIETIKTIRSALGTQGKEEIFSAVKEKYKLNDWKYKTHNDITDALAAAYYLHKTY